MKGLSFPSMIVSSKTVTAFGSSITAGGGGGGSVGGVGGAGVAWDDPALGLLIPARCS